KMAQQVVHNAQNSSYPGWHAMGGDATRYWLINNLQDRRYQVIRTFLYDFSRHGLDLLADDIHRARTKIAEILGNLQSIQRYGQSSVLDQVFFAAKANELVGVLSGLGPQERMKAYNLLTTIDPSNSNKYEALRN